MLAVFDLDNTLVDRTAAIAAWAHELSENRSLGPDAVDWILKTDDNGMLPRGTFADKIKQHFQLPDTVQTLQRDYERRYPQHMRCEPAVLDGLTRLRVDGWRVGVTTNGLTATQDAVLQCTGLANHLDGWCISEAEGVRKPDPEIFTRTARRCGASEDLIDAWMIGDSPTADIEGGHAAGMRTIWIRHSRTWHAPPAPNHTVDTVIDAIDILLNHSRTSTRRGSPSRRT
ncbi:HAD family hydrolase [Actinophytocola sediminis]